MAYAETVPFAVVWLLFWSFLQSSALRLVWTATQDKRALCAGDRLHSSRPCSGMQMWHADVCRSSENVLSQLVPAGGSRGNPTAKNLLGPVLLRHELNVPSCQGKLLFDMGL